MASREANKYHHCDVIMGAIASKITSLMIVYSTVYSEADQRKHQSSASLAFVLGIHRGPVNSPHKWSITRNVFPFDDVIMIYERQVLGPGSAEFRIFITTWARMDGWYRCVKWYPAILRGLCPRHGSLARYVKLRVVHATGMPGTFSPPLQVSNPDMHHGTCMMHVPWCMLGSLTSGVLWSQWQW